MAVLIMLGTAVWRQAILPSAKPLWLVADALLVAGLLLRFKLAYAATLFFAGLGTLVAWLASVVSLGSRAVWGIRGRRAAALTMVAFASMILIVISYGVRT